MKKSINTFLLFVLLISPGVAIAQLNHFIYLQTEGRQPFYAKLDQKVFSSSVSGYLIIPKLNDGTYNVTIGFPKNENGEQVFVCRVENKDAGYLIKNFGEKGWGLFNLQTLDVIMAGNGSKEKEIANTGKKDEFADMLSDVVNDPSIKKADKPEEPTKPGNSKKELKEEPKVAVETVVENKVEPVSNAAASTRIIKKQLVDSKKGIELIYIDSSAGKQDTISILIPVEEELVKAKAQTQSRQEDTLGQSGKIDEAIAVVNSPKAEVSTTVTGLTTTTEEKASAEKKKIEEDKKFLPVDMPVAGKTSSGSEEAAATPMINSDCKNFATEEDFLKLRKKMAAAGDDEGMINAARKSFKAKCFTTGQVKNLSVLFLKDAGKYTFFDLAYPYVSDSSNFGTLESLLTDPYYISRFKAMIRH